jgi:hypothetical protein
MIIIMVTIPAPGQPQSPGMPNRGSGLNGRVWANLNRVVRFGDHAGFAPEKRAGPSHDGCASRCAD